MTTATTLIKDDMDPTLVSRDDAALPLSRSASSWTLYALTLRQHLHGRRWIAAALLFLLPAGLAIVIRLTGSSVPSRFLEFVLLWILVPQALLPLVALLYASGIVQDEQEEQTITYLLVRPISKPLIYVVKMAATWTTTILLVIALTMLTYASIYAGAGEDITAVASRCIKTAAILSLAAIAYCSIFGAISLLTKRTLIVGILYTAIVEGLLASLPLSLRWGTIIYYTRMLAYRTLDFVVTWPHGRQDDVAAAAWFLNTESDPSLAEHPQLSTCVLIVVSASLVCTAFAGWLCSLREFHVKTPEKE
jgi:ABC-2 type transport system permease protein